MPFQKYHLFSCQLFDTNDLVFVCLYGSDTNEYVLMNCVTITVDKTAFLLLLQKVQVFLKTVV